ncbi:L,D-transpeptidase family protein [Phenylobacterium sp. 58.2.17]|uniref:L,D-transpeptidase family protein n=1 Tax=Phenylobacterium sp. 58.2.17 TaxID=2969306 RepID=UPI002264A1DB|nr:L,D-transpeptidase family protein [Phenylobacterium sp. 58.2.17]MCX7586019.1 L,D-transpeptidase family protein [Phenylobacterium sp. 58.2.17]
MIFTAMSDGSFRLDGRITRCALGKGGVIAAADKREGDGKSPLGTWGIRRVLFRPDKGGPPQTRLPTKALERDDGWCDAPGDPAYNRAVKLPHPASAEQMWREDDVYDLVCILAHNDDPPVPGLGSAIFLHLARPGYAPTEGCVALSREDMLELLSLAKLGDAVAIEQV